MQLFYEPEAVQGDFILNKEEATHCIKVLRKKAGDQIHVTDGKGHGYTCIISDDNIKKCLLRVVDTELQPKPSRYRHIAIAPTKNLDRMEWFVEKAVEIGIDELSFIICDNSERKVLKTDRLEKKAVSAMKQSLKYQLPQLNEAVPFTRWIKGLDAIPHKFIAYVDFDNPKQLIHCLADDGAYLVLIGPEGDFSEKELTLALENAFEKVSLGNSRLRTETAGMVACHILNL